MTDETHTTHFQPSVDPLAVGESVIPTETPPVTSETTAIQLQSTDDSSMPAVNGIIDGASVDAWPAIELPPAQSTSPSGAGGTVERLPPGLLTSASVPPASIIPDVVSPVDLVDPAAVGDGHVHPAVQPTLCKHLYKLGIHIHIDAPVVNDSMTNILMDATNSYATTDQSQTASNSNEPAKRVLMQPSKVINGR